MKLPWGKGPSAPYLNALGKYEVTYRYRKPGEFIWTKSKIQMVTKSKTEARKRCIGFLSKRGYEVDVMRVKLASKEAPVQSGEQVEVVSDAVYTERKEKQKEEVNEGVEERLRKQGIWLPSSGDKPTIH